MAKRKTKAQREEEQRAALFRRIADIYLCATGEVQNEDGDNCYLTVDQFVDVHRAIECAFGWQRPWMAKAHNADEFKNAASLTDWLFNCGYRADSFFEKEATA